MYLFIALSINYPMGQFTNLIKAFDATMQGIGSIIYRQLINFSLNYKLALSNTVSNPPYHSSKITRISEITYKNIEE